MSNAPETGEKKKATVRRQRSIYQVHYDIKRREEMTARPIAWPAHPGAGALEVQKYGQQVAGHKKTEDTKYLGLLQCSDGTILKPILKASQQREVDFYRRTFSTSDAELVELRKLTAKYFGTTHYTYGGLTQEYIILEDLCTRMLEPCIMDVKIGKRTWDPLASEDKIKREQQKYAQCKQQYGFCIPGFQVFRLATGQLCRYSKEYGKRLHSHHVVDAIRNYLNGVGTSLCRALLLQFLSELWKIQTWARRGARLRLYCASLLLVYDAAKLRQCCAVDGGTVRAAPAPPAGLPARRRSIHSLHSGEGASFSGQLSAKGPVYKKLTSVPLTSLTVAQTAFSPPPAVSSPWTEALERLNHNHSFEHNYEDKLSKIKMNYRAVLDQLSYDAPTPNPWGSVKIIDFAHAFFVEDDELAVDHNFREGVDNFVEIFECFLRETDDQVM